MQWVDDCIMHPNAHTHKLFISLFLPSYPEGCTLCICPDTSYHSNSQIHRSVTDHILPRSVRFSSRITICTQEETTTTVKPPIIHISSLYCLHFAFTVSDVTDHVTSSQVYVQLQACQQVTAPVCVCNRSSK